MESDSFIELSSNNGRITPFSEPMEIQEEVDMDEHSHVINENTSAVRIYCDGVFDLFHAGHVNALRQAKGLFPHVHLIVGIPDDAETERKKGKCILSISERVAIIKELKFVDQVILNAPWTLTDEFISAYGIDYVAHDGVQYTDGGIEDIYANVKSNGKFISLQRTSGISTTDILVRILKNSDELILRSVHRGVDPGTLGVSWNYVHFIQLRKFFTGLFHCLYRRRK